MRLLREALTKSLDKITSATSAAKLRKAFPEMLGPKRSGFIADGVVLSCFEQVMEGIQDNTKNEFEEVLKEFNVQPLLNKLDSVAQASDRSPSDEPPARIKNKGDAETAIVYASFKAKLAAVEQLREQVGAVKRENGALQQEVAKKRRKVEAAEKKAETGKSDIVQAIDNATPILVKAERVVKKFISKD
eukprot:gene2148-18146_t